MSSAPGPLPDEELDAIRARHVASTPNVPAEYVTAAVRYAYTNGAVGIMSSEAVDQLPDGWRGWFQDDEPFVSNAHGDVGALLAEVARLKASLDAYRDDYSRLCAVEYIVERAYRKLYDPDVHELAEALGLDKDGDS
jgi:hypothetical protein